MSDVTSEETGHTSREEAIVIVMGLSGTISVKILADESATEARLRDLLRSIRPILELLHKTVNTLHLEPVGARS